MKEVTFYFQNLEPTLCLNRFALAFLPFIVDLTFDKILNTYMRRVTVGKQLSRNVNSLADVQKIPFLQMPRRVPFKNTKQNTWKKLVITLICKLNLKALLFALKLTDLVETFKYNFMLFKLS